MPIPAQIPISYPELRGKYAFRKRIAALSVFTGLAMVVISWSLSTLMNTSDKPALTESVAVASRSLAADLFPVSVIVLIVSLVMAVIFTGLALRARNALRDLYPEQFRRDH